ncbi:MAG: hypothetical protein QF483_04700 [Gammaproteobacteria bacterium]|jgi:hypothetical protein|nr:hypothetical protein [Chromatiales bacterium]MCP4924349.1 hypothetical protein [Gammaproteobacteria bacterium]MDP7153312.1 hypothetical protein [Gammaproteobacteria bacterium]MDP7296422.1 hypothetical protein [Gammaproteobacteria bacterium]MDP7419158.1 hypothetical protein [Gammaproteobacteria bacterium]
MTNNNITSLRHYKAQRVYKNFMSLPPSQRTNARTALLLEVVFDYAYEYVPRIQRHSLNCANISAQESARISARLEEFLPLANEQEPIMKWLNDNMVSEAWSYPEDRRQFVRDCLIR